MTIGTMLQRLQHHSFVTVPAVHFDERRKVLCCFSRAVIHDKHAAACASGITTNPNDRGGTVTVCPAATTVGSTCGRVVSFTSRTTLPDTDTNLQFWQQTLYVHFLANQRY